MSHNKLNSFGLLFSYLFIYLEEMKFYLDLVNKAISSTLFEGINMQTIWTVCGPAIYL